MATSAASGSARLTLVLGGARSGKSRYAESLVTALPAPWIYVATAEARDAEMAERIAAHQARRGAGWRTLETPRDVVGALTAHGATPLLVDCLTLWLANALLASADVDAEIERLEAALEQASAPLVLVANE
ncbi:MAG TPA: bifunctional adenosylcobinamide kinase/adenosylcobinamide-phosphate guanylyltransferase, partial [Xanthobacteraceae bacterium]|nr:bifunctional adenosylcobinamide kinase/adenosylcobinamide-phosphate guanylyltransferase [Xanthobacteraceae bacterium]